MRKEKKDKQEEEKTNERNQGRKEQRMDGVIDCMKAQQGDRHQRCQLDSKEVIFLRYRCDFM